jgi:hypothetical protein
MSMSEIKMRLIHAHVIAGEESGDSLVGVALLTEEVSPFETVVTVADDVVVVLVVVGAFTLFSTVEDDLMNWAGSPVARVFFEWRFS